MGGPATNGDSGTARTPREGVHPERGPPTRIASTLLHRRHRNERAATVNQWPPVRRLQVETAIYGMEIRAACQCQSTSTSHRTLLRSSLKPSLPYRAIPMRNLLNGRRWHLST